MGFAELSIADIAAEYDLDKQAVFELCDRFQINYKNERTCLALEDAKIIIQEILANKSKSDAKWKRTVLLAEIGSLFAISNKIDYCFN